MVDFVPSYLEPASRENALYVVMRGSDVLVIGEDGAGVFHEEPLAFERSFALGALGGRPLFVVEVGAGVEAPLGARFVHLRMALLAAGASVLDPLSAAAEVLHWDREHQRCGRCGAALVVKAGERAKHCDACGTDTYPRISPAIIVLVHDGDQVLLTHVAGRPFYALVAGFLEPGETLEACVAREVKEETGIVVSDLRYFGSQPWPFPSQVMIGFTARRAGGEPVADGVEIEEARFFSVKELPPLPPRLSIARAMLDDWIGSQG